ncbi:MAG: hypothetical protein WC374_12275 [Phycisphaerae bacterium]|jgi:hypothetical protein
MEERELVKIKSDNPAHPKGYYTQFKDCMKPGDVVFGEKSDEKIEEAPVLNTEEGIQSDAGDSLKEHKNKKKRK